VKVSRWINYLHRIPASPYIIINAVFLFILLGIFCYSAVFSAERNNYPIPSSLEILKEGKDLSSGLSHSFSELMRGRMESARKYNEYGLRIFMFFMIQLIMRLIFMFLFIRSQKGIIWVFVDTGTSIVLFLITFWPFICRFWDMILSL
jgi:hypothetical protein